MLQVLRFPILHFQEPNIKEHVLHFINQNEKKLCSKIRNKIVENLCFQSINFQNNEKRNIGIQTNQDI